MAICITAMANFSKMTYAKASLLIQNRNVDGKWQKAHGYCLQMFNVVMFLVYANDCIFWCLNLAMYSMHIFKA